MHITSRRNKQMCMGGKRTSWLFDLDYLTDSMNYHPVSSENQANLHAGQKEANQNAGIEEIIDAGDYDKEDESAQDVSIVAENPEECMTMQIFVLVLVFRSLQRTSHLSACQEKFRLNSWAMQKATIMATSTTEAEYVAGTSCCGQVLWIQNQMLDYGFNFMNTKIYIDNESTICIVKNQVYSYPDKHIAIRHHFIRDAYEKKLIQVLKIYTDDNVADLLTKAFDVSRFHVIGLLLIVGLLIHKAALDEEAYS
ncbi:hypothetical protein Tco_0345043 [Tanacetum coccineum]